VVVVRLVGGVAHVTALAVEADGTILAVCRAGQPPGGPQILQLSNAYLRGTPPTAAVVFTFPPEREEGDARPIRLRQVHHDIHIAVDPRQPGDFLVAWEGALLRLKRGADGTLGSLTTLAGSLYAQSTEDADGVGAEAKLSPQTSLSNFCAINSCFYIVSGLRSECPYTL